MGAAMDRTIRGASPRPTPPPPPPKSDAALAGLPALSAAKSPQTPPPSDENPPLERVKTSVWLTSPGAAERRRSAASAAGANAERSDASAFAAAAPLSAFRDEKTADVVKAIAGSAASTATGMLFEAASSDPTYRRLLAHYMASSGERFCLTPAEVKGLGVTGLTISNSEEFAVALRSSVREMRRTGAAASAPVHIEQLVSADKPLTLGNFTARVDGTLTVHPEGTWEFKGDLRTHDIWDFDRKPFGAADHRTIAGEVKTRLSALLLHGKPFVVTSAPVPVEQRTGEPIYHFSRENEPTHAIAPRP